MIQEAYCSYEVAELLKEKGFNDPFTHMFINKDNVKFDCSSTGVIPKETIACPTHQMAMKWLREEKNIFIVIEPHAYDYINEKNKSYVYSLWVGDNYYEYIESKDYPSYEDTVEAALKCILKSLI